MVKNIFFILIGFSILSITNAQTFSISPSDSVYVAETVTSNNDEVVLTAYVKNDSSDDLTFKWRVTSMNSPMSWNVSFCDNTNCLDLGTTNESTFFLPADSTSILKMAYLPFLEGGVSDIGVSVSIEGLAGPSVTVLYKADITAEPISGVKEIDAQAISIFPNPASNFIKIKGIEDANDVNSIEVFSIIGKEVLRKEISSLNDLQVDIQNLDHGVYLVKLFDSKRSVFFTKTFIKK